jgi:outer membrane protein OmpA-like peptidoglycan-associated protein
MATENTESGLASSMTDLMTSLAVIFILLLVASLNNAQQESEMTKNLILAKLKQKMEEELKGYQDKGFEVKDDPKDPLGLIVVVPEGLLNFEFNKSDVPGEGIKFLNTILPKMASTMCSDEFRKDIGSIVVEGHADSVGEDDHNLQLSQARSMAVARESLKVLSLNPTVNGERASPERNCFLDLLSATGRGSREPITDSQGAEDRNRSRRVVFKIRVRSLEEKLIKAAVPTGSAEKDSGAK